MKKIISGKVRDVYELSEKELAIVTTDRISAFDVILPTPIPNKGVVLNTLSSFWFEYTKDIVPNHMISKNTRDMPAYFQDAQFSNRTVLVKKLDMLQYEFVVRGYIFGNMWDSYAKTRTFCGYTLNEEYQMAGKLRYPILTPSTKSVSGHDEYITIAQLSGGIGSELTARLEKLCLELYTRCCEYAASRGIIIADTKFEFGFDENGGLVLADEIFTPDSSRFWDAAAYRPGTSPKSYDKQFVRDWLLENKLDGVVPAPELPDGVVRSTGAIYNECLTRLTAKPQSLGR